LARQVLEAGSLLGEARVMVDILLAVGGSFLFKRYLAGESGGGGLRMYGRDECLGRSVFGLGAQLSGFDDIVNVARVICLLLGSRVGGPVSVNNELGEGVVSCVYLCGEWWCSPCSGFCSPRRE
jgi:hypothetical protein